MTSSARLALIAVIGLLACNGGLTDVRTPPPNCSPGEPAGLVDLQVGDVEVIDGAVALACVSLPSVAETRDFLFIVSNASNAPKQFASLTIVADASTSLAPSASRGLASFVVQPAEPDPDGLRVALEGNIRSQERRLQASLTAADRATLAGAAVTSRALGRATLALAVGDTLRQYNVPDISKSDACKSVFTLTAVVKAIGTNVIIVQDTAAPTGGFTAGDFTSIAAEIDTALFPTDTAFFGPPSDRDANGRVIVLYTPKVNALTPSGSAGYIGGFFFGGDLFPRASCTNSNLAEIIYLLVPDPSPAKFGSPHSVAQVKQDTRGTIAHEMQHLINKGCRLDITLDTHCVYSPFEVTWLDEGMAHFAEELAGRREKGWTPTQRLTATDFGGSSSDLYLVAFFKQNLNRFKFWLQAPDKKGAIGADADTSLAVRGAAWAMLRYASDRYATSGVAPLLRALVAGPDTGVRNLTLRTGVPFDTLLAGWMIANFESTSPALPAKYTYASWAMRSAVPLAASGGPYPLAVTLIGTMIDVPVTSPPASGRYLRFQSSTTSPPFAFKVLAADRGLVGSVGSPRLYVVRLQ